jgi:hypothetical protein
MKWVREVIAANCDGAETHLRCTSVLACNSPHQGDISVKTFIEPKATQDRLSFKNIAANCAGEETCLQRTSVLACDSSHQGDIACKGGETCLQCTSVLACNSPLQNNNSNVVLQCITCASVLTSDNVSRTKLILKRQHERKCIACVKQPRMIDACQCVTCATLKHRVNFSNRQWSKP